MTQAPKRVRFISLIGRMCAGKGMAAKYLVETLPNAKAFSFGQLLRDSRSQDHPLHVDLQQYREEGDAGLVSSETAIQPFIESGIRKLYEEGVETIIADGTPRTGIQTPLILNFLDRLRAEGYQVHDQYVYFLTPPALSEQRIDHRRIEFLKARKPIRVDDQRGKSEVRRKEFEEKTWEAVRHIAAMDKLIVVDARRTLDELHQSILQELSRDALRPLGEVYEELRGWTDVEEDMPTENYESRMERR